MASALDVVLRAERLLTHHDREARNRLDGAILAGATQITLEYDPDGISQGSWIGIDWEIFDVWGQPSGKVVTVDGGQQGTTEAAHADDAIVIVKPKFPRQFILDAVNAELDDLSSPVHGLFQVTSLDITGVSGVYGYNLTSSFLDVIEASWEPSTSSKARRYLNPGDYSIGRGLDTADFASGNAFFYRGLPSDSVLRVRYAGAFTNITTATADVAATSGLPATALDILSIGAAIRMLDPLEPSRNYSDAQGDTRRAEEVPPGASDRSTRSLRQLRFDRIRAEAARLRQMYPMVMR